MGCNVAMEMMMLRCSGFAFDASFPYDHYFDDLLVIFGHFHSIPSVNGSFAFWDPPEYTR